MTHFVYRACDALKGFIDATYPVEHGTLYVVHFEYEDGTVLLVDVVYDENSRRALCGSYVVATYPNKECIDVTDCALDVVMTALKIVEQETDIVTECKPQFKSTKLHSYLTQLTTNDNHDVPTHVKAWFEAHSKAPVSFEVPTECIDPCYAKKELTSRFDEFGKFEVWMRDNDCSERVFKEA